MDIAGKSILITGGAKGIGKALAETVLNRQGKVAVIDHDKAALEGLPEIDALIKIHCDITSPEDVAAGIQSVRSSFGHIDALVNCAGLIWNEPLVSFLLAGLQSHSLDTWNRVINTNLTGTFLVSSQVINTMISQRIAGVIVNISSICACGNAGQSAYSASKAAIEALTVTWAKELGCWGIRVAGIAPGFTETETTKSAISASVAEEWVNQTPLRRMADPMEIVHAILFALENDYFSGKTLRIDGGLRL